MTDAELVRKKLAQIETWVGELRTLSRLEEIERDVREERFVEHTLQISIQAALDIASHIVSDERLGEPSNNRALFSLLARHHWISDEQNRALSNMAGFRNILVHNYGEINLRTVRQIVEDHLGDLLDFVAAIRQRLE